MCVHTYVYIYTYTRPTQSIIYIYCLIAWFQETYVILDEFKYKKSVSEDNML